MERRVVTVVSGYFNPLHIGHLRLLDSAREAGDIVVVIVNNDEQQILKKGRVIMPEGDRASIVAALRPVDEVVLSIDTDTTVRKTLETIAMRYRDDRIVFANGGDRSDSSVVPEAEICDRYSIEMVFDLGGGDKADSSSRINQTLGLED